MKLEKRKAMTSSDIKDKIIELQDELIEHIKSIGMDSPFRSDELKYVRLFNSLATLKSQLSETQESKSDFINVIKKRIEYFNTKYHKYEVEELQNALDIINRLVPPNDFAKAGKEKRNKLIKAYSDLVIEIDKHKGTTIKEVKLRNKIANLKLEIR